MKCQCGGELEAVHTLRIWFRCKTCQRMTSFNEAVVRNAFPIQKMPEPIRPIYFYEPDEKR